MLRVLIPVDHAVGISGPHRNVVGSLNALTARDDVTVVLVTGKVDADEPYARSKNIDIRLGYHPHLPGKWLDNLRLLRNAAKGCDIIYVPTNLKSLLYAQSVRRPHRPLVAGPNVTHLPLPGRNDAPGKIELRLLSNAWFENSRLRQAHVASASKCDSVRYIHHAIDLARFNPDNRDPELWARFGVPEGTRKVVFVGRDSEQRKGVDQLLDAIRLVEHSGHSDLHFVLVGKLSEHTRARASKHSNVTLIGFRTGTELASMYASADICVVPSSWESFGFTLLEAMASGCAVVCSHIAAFAEIIDDCDCAYVVEIARADSTFTANAGAVLAQAFIRLSADQSLRHDLGERARKRAEAHFSESRLGRDLVDLFQSLSFMQGENG